MITIDSTLFLQLINFLLLIFILNKLLFKPVMKLVEERRQQIEGKEELAAKLLEETEEKAARYARDLQQAKTAATQLRNDIRAAGLKEEANIIAEASKESENMLMQIRTSINAEMETARLGLTAQANEMARVISSKLLGRSVS